MLEKIHHKSAPKEVVNALIHLYHQGEFLQILGKEKQFESLYQDSIELLNIFGSTNLALQNFKRAITNFNKAIKLNSNIPTIYYNLGLAYHHIGNMDDAIVNYKKAIDIKPDYDEALNNMGMSLEEKGDIVGAIDKYNKVIAINPKHAGAYYNLGNVFYSKDNFILAIENFKRAIDIKPDYADAYFNLGNALNEQGKLEEAIKSYKRVLSIKPDFVATYSKLGNALQEQGKLEEAIESYNKALSIEPDSAETYNNMGNALQDQGKLEEAMEAYNKALVIKPNDAEVYWNLSGLAENISESKKCIKKCLKIDPNYEKAKLTLSALKFYEGNKSEFRELIKSSYKNHPFTRSFSWVFSLPKLPPLYFYRWALFEQMIKLTKKNRPFYEFGVWRGEAFKYLIKTFKKGYGFDTFEGLPEDWHNKKAGTYSSDGNLPKIKGGEFIVGKFEDTLSDFFSETRPKASIINFDADLYSSTICALNYAKPVIDEHTILIFDEFIMNKYWEQDEYKALEEFCYNNHFEYEVLGISFFTKQVAVRLIAI